MSRQNSDEPMRYIIRSHERAREDIDAAHEWIAKNVSPDIADEWLSGLEDTIAGLSEFPRRCPRAEKFRGEVRRLLYRRPGSRIEHHVLFRITGEEQNSLDPPTVTLLHVRHSSARPLTRREIREIEAEE